MKVNMQYCLSIVLCTEVFLCQAVDSSCVDVFIYSLTVHSSSNPVVLLSRCRHESHTVSNLAVLVSKCRIQLDSTSNFTFYRNQLYFLEKRRNRTCFSTAVKNLCP